MLPEMGILSAASTELRDLLGRASREIPLADGEVLFAQGDAGDSLYVVQAGSIELSVLSRDGRKLSLDVLQPGAVFGEIALFDPGPRTAMAAALGESSVLRVRNVDLMRELRQKPELAVDLVRVAGQRMRWMGLQLTEHVFLPMPCRLARKLLHLTAHQQQGARMLDMSQAEIAEFVGATREAVSKTLSTWRARGWIDSSRGGVRLVDEAALKELAAADDL